MSKSFAEANSIAEAFVRPRLNATSLVDYPGTEPSDLQSAWAIQDAAIPLFGEPVAGWKVGRINPPWLEKLGINRLSGPIFTSRVQHAKIGNAPVGFIFDNGFGDGQPQTKNHEDQRTDHDVDVIEVLPG